MHRDPIRLLTGVTSALVGLNVLSHTGLAQGCIAVRSCPTPPVLPGAVPEADPDASKWSASVAYRWYQSDRHYSGDVEQKQRQAIGNQVINKVHAFDVAASYAATPRITLTLDIPFAFSERSSWYEHDFVTRHSMSSSGLGDVRLLSSYWIFDPKEHANGNISIGLGLKAPTGDDEATDISYRTAADGGPTRRPVDPSIQPGDGGWGISLDLQAYQRIYKNLFGYMVGSYMMTPQEQSSTEFTIADIPRFKTTFTSLRSHNTIPDQYLGRVGFDFQVLPEKGLSVSLGTRMEGVPVYDIVGGSMGWRRPGYTVSIEPGISWMYKKNAFSLLTPVAMYRNRERSAPEVALGLPRGDSAFADYSILFSFSHHF